MSVGVHISAVCCCKMGNRDFCRTSDLERGNVVNTAGDADLEDLHTAQVAAKFNGVNMLPLVVCLHSCTKVLHVQSTHTGQPCCWLVAGRTMTLCLQFF